MKRYLFVLMVLTLTLSACSPGAPPPTTTPQPATVPPSPIPPPTETPLTPPTATEATPLTPTPATVTSFPDPNNYQWVPVVSGLNRPVDIQSAGDGSGRLFIVDQTGRIRIVQDGQLLPTPFLDIISKIRSQGSEQGLLGLAFHPNYAKNGQFFVNYTDRQGNTVIARYQVSVSDPNQADPNSEVRLIQVDQPFANHNGGGLAFGPDGYLYAGLGDGGSGGDPMGNGQSVETLLGKLLRIDVNSGDPYAIPADNPFASGGGLPEIWAYGLRNPWRFSFDRATGDLYIGDVGQNSWEEIDHLPAGTPGGTNFGWNVYEGTHQYGQARDLTNAVFPVAEYGHDQGCSVTGGVVYRGPTLPEWQGIYLYSDYCSGLVWGMLPANGQEQSQVLFQTGFSVVTFGQDESGEVYLSNYGSGTIYRLQIR
jgi:glucose/arabinose dehydrogenase